MLLKILVKLKIIIMLLIKFKITLFITEKMIIRIMEGVIKVNNTNDL